jgi:tetratricopeptide (TPR) repeat protein
VRAIGIARGLYEEYGKLPAYELVFGSRVQDYFEDASTEQQADEAQQRFEDFLVKWPDANEVHSTRAHCLAQLDDNIAALSRAIEQFPGQGIYYTHRGEKYREQFEFELALADMKQASELNSEYFAGPYHRAVVALGADDQATYRDACQKHLTDFADLDRPIETYLVTWTCALAEHAIDDYGVVISLARHAADKDPERNMYLTGLGAILMRAGKYDEARTQLEHALAAGDLSGTSPSFTRYFVAMTEFHLGNQQAAAQQLHIANLLTEKELAESPIWNRRLTLEFLRKEAEALIGTGEGSGQ